ncbi:penicillin acylase family protein [Rubrobacter marinus]|uniref:Penicillin acylase family protein n=1 Tax=Rubrobacter marinus TaxID=2653852 RepID=A0A6G8PYM2_9ACTN|nr:penicillin acylase family protein [Rubrobacter marinus]QIN79268.1 penicillin acylase family protein [Rubrobacter marinus]
MNPSAIPETLVDLLSRALAPALRLLSKSSLPRLDGSVELPGPNGTVEILRDRFGVPQIFASDEHDLFFAQGYVHAQDRFFQMELQRRAGHGRLAELLGAEALPFDRLSRTVGFAGIARSVERPSGALAVIEAYSAGINACLEAGPLPPELALLRHRPEPWTPLDTAAWSLVMAWSLSSSWESKLLTGEEPEDLLPQTDPGAGSNAWAVAPWRSATGSALLAGDPHLSLGIPCLWYELGLYGGPYRVVGASLPGTPGVVIGHNEEIAWSVTAALTDVQDLYAEHFSEDGRLYEHRGEWREAGSREETIRVRGRREPFVQTVRTTLHGPVVTDAVATDGKGEDPGDLALRWAVPDPTVLVESGLAVNRARDKDEFLAALQGWTTPNQNFVYADRAGNVGWALAGLVPVRRGFRGDRVLPGPPGEHEWDGFLPSSELPGLFDPEDGQIASANEPPPGAGLIPGYYLPPYRKDRISALLAATEKHSPESFWEIQGDLYCEPAHALATRLARLAPRGEEKVLLRELLTWDGHLTADSRPGAIARVALEHLIRRAAGDVNPSGYPVPNGIATYVGDLVPELVEGLDELPEGMLAGALEDAVSTLRETLGEDPGGWSWGALHAAELRHPLGAVRALRGLLNRGPFPIGGDANTVRHAAFGGGKSDEHGHPRFGPVARGPNYRFVVDTGDWDEAVSVVAPGQSGHPASPYYDDEIDLWLGVRYRPMVFGRKTAELAARHRLVLEPAKEG